MAITAGLETRVNTVVQGNQFEQRVVALEDGGWLVSWRNSGVFGATQQAYNADGSPRGAATHVQVSQNHGLVSLEGGGWAYITSQAAFYFNNDGSAGPARDVASFSSSTFWDRATDFAWLSNGGWVGTAHLEDNYEIGQRAFDYDGTAIAPASQVNSTVEGNQGGARYIGTEDGGWVVAWMSEYMAPEGPKYQIFTQAFNADGTKRGDEIVAGTADRAVSGPYITKLKDGSFVTVWSETDNHTNATTILQLRLDAYGVPTGEETTIAQTYANSYAEPRVTALESGGWVVTWRGVAQQAFDENGIAIGNPASVAYAPNIGHTVVALDNGGWVVFHWSYGDIVQRVYSPAGRPIGQEQTVNTYTLYQQRKVDAAALPDGGWVVTWESDNQDGSGTGIYQRVFHLSNDAPIVANEIGEQVATEDQTFIFQFASDTFADIDGETLIYTATLANGDPLPIWLSFDPSTRTFSGTPQNDDVGVLSIQVTATDESNASVSDTFGITVTNTNDAPIVANPIANQAAMEDQFFTFQLAANVFADVDAGDSLRYSAQLANGAPLPAWLSFDPVTRTFSGTPTNSAVGVISVKVIARDGSNASASEIFDITVANVNDAPTGASKTLALLEDNSHTFTASNFGFADIEGNGFAGVTIVSVGTGSLTLNGVAVTAGQFVEFGDFARLAWNAGKDVNGKGLHAFTFTVMDNGGTENGGVDTSAQSYAMNFNVSEVIDRFIGTKRGDKLIGTDGSDVLDGKKGNDRLTGGLGDDVLTGGVGKDRFIFRTGDGADTIKDFHATGNDHDILDLAGLASITSFTDLKKNHLEQVGKHVVIDGLDGDEIILKNVKIKDLDAGDFVF